MSIEVTFRRIRGFSHTRCAPAKDQDTEMEERERATDSSEADSSATRQRVDVTGRGRGWRGVSSGGSSGRGGRQSTWRRGGGMVT